jgi:hypothetical protein
MKLVWVSHHRIDMIDAKTRSECDRILERYLAGVSPELQEWRLVSRLSDGARRGSSRSAINDAQDPSMYKLRVLSTTHA